MPLTTRAGWLGLLHLRISRNGALIVTSGNHSCSGYSDDLDQVPFGTVVDIYSEEAWLTACRFWLENRAHSVCMRAIAERLCSYESMSQQWSDILGIFNQNRYFVAAAVIRARTFWTIFYRSFGPFFFRVAWKGLLDGGNWIDILSPLRGNFRETMSDSVGA